MTAGDRETGMVPGIDSATEQGGGGPVPGVTLFGDDLDALYAGADAIEREVDLQGWRGSTHPLLDAVIREFRPATIIEIGVWKGRSVVHMARVALAIGLTPRIYAVDTWLGSPEHWTNDAMRADLRLRNGYPTLYETFLKNIRAEGLDAVIEPVPMPSETAAVVFARKGVKADLIHSDGGHEFESVLRDLTQFYPLLSENGVIVGDDYGTGWRGVKRAFDRFAARNEAKLFGVRRKCVLARADLFDARVVPMLAREGLQ